MSKEENFLIQVLSDHLLKRATKPSQGIEWDIVRKLSQSHQIMGIIYFQCREWMPKEIRFIFEKAYLSTLLRSSLQTSIADEICKEYNKTQIKYCVIKGLTVAKYYPVPPLRTMGDIDYLIKGDCLSEATNILRKLGYIIQNDSTKHEIIIRKGNICIELHDILERDELYNKESQKEFINSFESYIVDNEIDSSFHFIYLLFHIRKHIMGYGIGIRQFCDLGAFVLNNKELKWDWIEKTLEDLEMLQFAHVCYSILFYGLGILVPVEYEMIEEESYNVLIHYLLNNGVFGTVNMTNNNAKEKTTLIFAYGPMWYRRISNIMRIIFPRYEIMIKYPNCNYVKSKAYLLPLAWLYRLYIIITTRSIKTVFRSLHHYFVSESEINEKKTVLKAMKLIE